MDLGDPVTEFYDHQVAENRCCRISVNFPDPKLQQGLGVLLVPLGFGGSGQMCGAPRPASSSCARLVPDRNMCSGLF